MSNDALFYSGVGEVDIAYAAGLFEGEGSISLKEWSIAISMTDIEPLQRIQKTVGGYITGPYSRNKNTKLSYKDFYTWGLHGYGRILGFYTRIKSYLSPRRLEQFEATLNRKPKAKVLSESCGLNSYAGYKQHVYKKENACLACLSAYREWEWVYRHKGEEWPGHSKQFIDRYGLVPHG
jgi:hypothetical protein